MHWAEDRLIGRLPSSLRRRKRLRLLRRQRREASERGDREDLLLLHRRAHHPLGGRGPPPSLPILITPKKTPPHQERPGTLVPMYLRQRGVRGVPTYNKYWGGGGMNISLEESTFGGLGFGLLLEENSQHWLY